MRGGRFRCGAIRESVLVLLFRCHTLVVIARFFLVFDDLSIQLVDEKINRRIHIVTIGIGMNLCALGGNCALGLVPVLLYDKDNAGAGHVVEVALNPANLLVYVGTQWVGDFDMLTGNGNLHQITPD
jgi:hypothetical protein